MSEFVEIALPNGAVLDGAGNLLTWTPVDHHRVAGGEVLQRHATDAADDMSGDARLCNAALVYDKAIASVA